MIFFYMFFACIFDVVYKSKGLSQHDKGLFKCSQPLQITVEPSVSGKPWDKKLSAYDGVKCRVRMWLSVRLQEVSAYRGCPLVEVRL